VRPSSTPSLQPFKPVYVRALANLNIKILSSLIKNKPKNQIVWLALPTWLISPLVFCSFWLLLVTKVSGVWIQKFMAPSASGVLNILFQKPTLKYLFLNP
jgi:hypothetical protein